MRKSFQKLVILFAKASCTKNHSKFHFLLWFEYRRDVCAADVFLGFFQLDYIFCVRSFVRPPFAELSSVSLISIWLFHLLNVRAQFASTNIIWLGDGEKLIFDIFPTCLLFSCQYRTHSLTLSRLLLNVRNIFFQREEVSQCVGCHLDLRCAWLDIFLRNI